VAAWLSETVVRGRGPDAIVSSNLTEGGGFFQGRNLRRAMDVCVCLLGADGRGWKEESTLFRPAPRGQHGFESRREGRPWVYKCCCVRL
jgi:hypothetical protein